MLYRKRSFFVRKTISIFVATLFVSNSLSFAQPLSKYTLRAAATASSVPADIVHLLKEPAKPVLGEVKSSSAGIMVEVNKLELGIASEAIAFLTGKEGLKSTDQWARLYAAAALSRLNKKIITLHINEIITTLAGNDGLRSLNSLREVYAAIALSRLDKEAIAKNMGSIITILTGKYGLKNVTPWIRAEAVNALSRLDKKIITPYIDEIVDALTGKEGLKSTDPLRKAYAAAALSRLDKKIITPYIDEIVDVLTGKEGLKSTDPWAKVYAAAALCRLDKKIITPHIDEIITTLAGNDGLKGKYLWIRLEAIEALAGLDKETIAPYINEIIVFLRGNEGLRCVDLWAKVYAEAAFQLIGKKHLPVIEVVINHTSFEKPLIIIAKDAEELSQRLNQDILNNLDISSKVLSSEEIELSSLFMRGKTIVNITREGKLEQVLLRFIASAVFAPITAKFSSAGTVNSLPALNLIDSRA